MPAFGRRPEYDYRSHDYPAWSLLRAGVRKTKMWPCNTWLDQGQEGACVGFSWSHEFAAEPEVVDVTNDSARALYRRAQQLDQWDGEEYEGTSVLAGAKAAKEIGHLVEYRWAWDINDVIDSICQLGPVVLGIDWYDTMTQPDVDGWISPVGDVVGGHAILAVGYDSVFNAVRLHNSWGQEWGDNGGAWMHVGYLAELLDAGGECCVPVTRAIAEDVTKDQKGCRFWSNWV